MFPGAINHTWWPCSALHKGQFVKSKARICFIFLATLMFERERVLPHPALLNTVINSPVIVTVGTEDSGPSIRAVFRHCSPIYARDLRCISWSVSEPVCSKSKVTVYSLFTEWRPLYQLAYVYVDRLLLKQFWFSNSERVLPKAGTAGRHLGIKTTVLR